MPPNGEHGGNAGAAAGAGSADDAQGRLGRVLDQVAFDEPIEDGLDGADQNRLDDRASYIPKYPVREMPCRSKISCLSFNSYIKPYLLSSDYEGIVTLWDSSVGTALLTLDEHEKRTWSVDFSSIDPMRMASGGDDTRGESRYCLEPFDSLAVTHTSSSNPTACLTVKLWSVNQPCSIATIETKANVCSVRFHPTQSHHLAFGSADHHLHYYDLRNISVPLHVFKGHRKAVSYVKFVNDNEMVTASTDCSLRLWSLRDSLPSTVLNQGNTNASAANTGAGATPAATTAAATGGGGIGDRSILNGGANATGAGSVLDNKSRSSSQSICLRTYTGHTNEKNFVGLSVNADGEFIACGSETNEVFTYYSKLSKPIVTHRFGNNIDSITGEELPHPDPSQFVSSLCWKRKTPNVLVAANSQGRVKVLEMI
eukprot:jgi/Hompol1/3318/HPOL_006465-RA